MFLEKGRGTAKVLGYTFVVFGAICLARVPTTNSKYYTKINDDGYLKYTANFRQLSYNQAAFPQGTTSNIGEDNTTIEFNIPRNTGNGIPSGNNSTEDVYMFRPGENCKVSQLGDTVIANSDFGQEQTVTRTGNIAQNIKVRLICKTETEKTGEDQGILGIEVKLGEELVSNASLDVYEKIGINGKYEDEFLYRSYTQEFSNPKETTSTNSITIDTSSETQFKQFIEWIVKYAHSSTGNTKLIKDYIVAQLNGLNLTESTKATDIPAIQGIKKVPSEDGKSVTFTIEKNLVGYIKTYNYYKSSVEGHPENDRFRLHFSIDVKEDNKDEINDILIEYLNQYVISDKSESYADFIRYFEGRAYNILSKSLSVNNLYAGHNKNEIELISITKLEAAIEHYYENSFALTANTADNTAFENDVFAVTVSNGTYDSLMSHDSNIILNSYLHNPGVNGTDNKTGHGHNIVEYANKGYLSDVDYSVDRYIIYSSETDANKFLLVKITPENENSMRIFYTDFDTVMDDYSNGVGIFTPSQNKSEIYINIKLSGPVMPTTNDYGKAQKVIDKLNTIFGKSYNESELRDNPTPVFHNRDGYYFVEYMYKIDENITNTAAEVSQIENNLKNQMASQAVAENNIQNILKSGETKVAENIQSEIKSDDNLNKIEDSNELSNNKTNIQDTSNNKVAEYSNDTQQVATPSINDANTEIAPDTNIN